MKVKTTHIKMIIVLMILAVSFVTVGLTVNIDNKTNADVAPVSLTMVNGAQIRTLDPMGLRFKAIINNYDSDDDTKTYGMLIVPNEYLTENNITSDYITALRAAGKTELAMMSCAPKNENGTCSIAGALVDVLETNYNRDFFGIGYIYDSTDQSYTYASVTGTNNIRQISYVAECAYNDNDADYSDTVDEYLGTVAAGRLSYTLNDGGESYSVTGIGTYTGAKLKIPTVHLGKAVTKIGASAFLNATTLTGIEIPTSITEIGSSAFTGCTNLVYNESENGLYLGNETNPYYVLVGVDNVSATSFTINASTKLMYGEAFENCTSLIEMTLPSGVTGNLGSGTFDCRNLQGLGDDTFYDLSGLQFTTYGNAYYLGNSQNAYLILVRAVSTSITSCTVNASTKMIYNEAFYNCTSLSSVTFDGSNVTTIGDFAFYNCTALTSVTVPSSVTVIEDGAFSGSGLLGFSVPNSVTTIGDYAFRSCNSLASVSFGSGLTNLGIMAFAYCGKLATFTMTTASSNYKVTSNVLLSADGKTIVQYPTGSATIDYTVTTAITAIADYAFYSCAALRRITLRSGVTSIGEYAFFGD